jgi:hypothetical protein
MVKAEIREATDDDRRFVAASWYDDYWKRWGEKNVSRPTYHTGQGTRIDNLLVSCLTLVAYFPQAPDEVLGWACMEGSVLHYCYVKAVYRRRGIASGILAGKGIKVYTHATDAAGKAFARSLDVAFNPYKVEQR